MKHFALFAVTAAMLFSLAACGCQASDTRPGNNNSSVGSNTETTQRPDNNTKPGGNATSNTNSKPNDNTDMNRPDSTIGDDLEDAVDDVGDAVGDIFDDTPDPDITPDSTVPDNTAPDPAGATGFRRMLDNARVHDADGVLTDGENSKW